MSKSTQRTKKLTPPTPKYFWLGLVFLLAGLLGTWGAVGLQRDTPEMVSRVAAVSNPVAAATFSWSLGMLGDMWPLMAMFAVFGVLFIALSYLPKQR